ncbi:hypothetical protein BV898_10628 [Hypsibius exemplaris]|uniref:Uncharacterized protein n=1 Tax=Hypsibius exemplaris TaxID=2072580 RepID=A0A1W0WJ73_HYPEX|nr:hypothetical protein BV898_10628 [Hypsibius exemplaris]
MVDVTQHPRYSDAKLSIKVREAYSPAFDTEKSRRAKHLEVLEDLRALPRHIEIHALFAAIEELQDGALLHQFDQPHLQLGLEISSQTRRDKEGLVHNLRETTKRLHAAREKSWRLQQENERQISFIL